MAKVGRTRINTDTPKEKVVPQGDQRDPRTGSFPNLAATSVFVRDDAHSGLEGLDREK